MILVPEYRGHRIEVEAVVTGMRWNATVRIHHMINGEVTDVDRNSGKVNIRASDCSKLQVILPPLAVATTNKGDRASLDVTIAPGR